MNLDGTLYLSIQCLKVCDNDMSKLGLLICHELAHYLMDHQPKRLTSIWLHNMVGNTFLKSKSEAKLFDPIRNEFENHIKLTKFCCFYPHQRIFDKYYERNCDTLALHLWNKTYGSQYKTIEEKIAVIDEMFNKDIKKLLDNIPDCEQTQVGKHILYDYRRNEVLPKLLKDIVN